ncbi:MAG: DUF2142 domain-containing protein, partial [Cellulomonadaceae bacterium]|nr:DUF2142 domain-containing protein [Cellulomonadaceae bacterium]
MTTKTRTRTASGRSSVAGWLSLGTLLLLLTAGWSAMVPLMGSPDEPSHVIRAAAVARGQWSGELGAAPTDLSRPGAGTIVLLPSDFAAALALPNCYAFQPDEPAACQQDVPPANGLQAAETFAGQYPPLYYLLVGWPSLAMGAEASIYGMRLVSALLTAALVTWGLFRLRSTPSRSLLPWTAAVALTPMCLFLGGTVNPQGLEIAAAFSFWAACLAVVSRPAGPTTSDLVHATVTGALLVNVRTSSPLWAAVIVAVALVLAPAGRWSAIVRHRAARWVLAGASVASLCAVAWIALHGDVVSTSNQFPQYGNLARAALAVAGQQHSYLVNMIGNFGWLDTPAPVATTLAWIVAGGALLLAGFAVPAIRRPRAALVLVVLATVGAPFVLQVPTAADTGLIWQGRYALPLAVGVPLVAGFVLVGRGAAFDELWRRFTRLCLPLLLVGHVAAFLWTA